MPLASSYDMMLHYLKRKGQVVLQHSWLDHNTGWVCGYLQYTKKYHL